MQKVIDAINAIAGALDNLLRGDMVDQPSVADMLKELVKALTTVLGLVETK